MDIITCSLVWSYIIRGIGVTTQCDVIIMFSTRGPGAAAHQAAEVKRHRYADMKCLSAT